MKAPLLSVFFSLFSILLFAQTEKVATAKVLFETNVSAIDTSHQRALDKLINLMTSDKINRIELRGYADDRGEENYNQRLSVRRVEAVKHYMLSKGVDAESIHAVALGEKPEPSYNVALQRKKSRSVEVELFQEAVFFSRSILPQTFKVDPAKEKVFTTRSGVVITIPPRTFQAQNGGPIFGNVEVQVTEYLTMSDFVKAGIHSASAEGMLESGGMFNIQAYYSGDRTPIFAKGKAIEVVIPVDTALPDMNVYYQGHGPSDLSQNQGLAWGQAESQQIWILNGNPIWRPVRPERIEVNFKNAMIQLGVDTSNLSDLSVFGMPENEEELAILLGKVIRTKDDARLQRIVDAIDIEEVYVARMIDTARTVQTGINMYPVFKRSTQREVRFSDSSFESADLKSINYVYVNRGKGLERFDLQEYKRQPMNTDSLVAINVTKQQYRMSVSELGMVNCDRFLRPKYQLAERVQPIIEVEGGFSKGLSVAIAFLDINALMPAIVTAAGEMRVGPIPVGQKATIIAYKTKGDVVHADVREITIGDEVIALDLQPMDRDEFNKRIDFL